MNLTPSQDQVMGQLRIIIPALGTIATAFGLSSAEAGSYTQIALASVGPISYLVVAIWSLVANSRASIMKAASKPVDANTPAPQIILPAQEADLAQKLPSNVTASAVLKVLLVAFALSFLAFPHGASAQTGNIIKDIATARAKTTVAPKVAVVPTAPTAATATGLQKFMDDLAALQKNIVDETIADLAAADVDAATLTNDSDPTSFRDPIAHACYPAATKFLQSLPAASPTTGTLIAVQLFQKQRDFVAQIQAGLPVYLKLGCAPLLGDEVTILTKVLGLVGVTVAANTLLPGISAIMPILP